MGKPQSQTTVYDPTCGSGSLLLKVADEARAKVTLYGQEKDSSTASLARMNMILHDNATATIEQGNTLANPKFLDRDALRVFDYVVANPPFSDKRWSTGLDPERDAYQRFDGIGIPPAKQGDYAYLLHILKSLKSTGAGACILPHGVLFRGNAEAAIRKNLIRRGVIKGIIGLPANLFYGTGIPACIVVLDKREAHTRKGIFMLDASAGFMKDGPKNRLRERDLHRIVDTFRHLRDVPKYARTVPLAEIEKNDFNLNLPRYIDSRPPEDQQDIAAHLKGGIPAADVDALAEYWDVCPSLRSALFTPRPSGESASVSPLPVGARASDSASPLPPGEGGGQRRVRVRYFDLTAPLADIKPAIQQHPQFAAYLAHAQAHFAQWRDAHTQELKALKPGFAPKDLIASLSESLLAHYQDQPLTDAYAIYQHLMDYWAETMQDDAWLIAADGWKAEPYRVLEEKKNKQGEVTRTVDKGWACDLAPKTLVVARYFAKQQAELDALAAELEATEAQLSELEEEHSGEDAAFSGFDKINAKAVKERLDEIHSSSSFRTPRRGEPVPPKLVIPGPAAGRNPDCEGRMPERTSAQSTARRASAMDGASQSVSSSIDDNADEIAILKRWQKLDQQRVALKKRIKDADAALDAAALAQYPQLIEADIKALVVDDKWLAALAHAINTETERAGQHLTRRVKELAERYVAPLPQLEIRVAELQAKVDAHLERMGFAWV